MSGGNPNGNMMSDIFYSAESGKPVAALFHTKEGRALVCSSNPDTEMGSLILKAMAAKEIARYIGHYDQNDGESDTDYRIRVMRDLKQTGYEAD